jgi:hypothetical protein
MFLHLLAALSRAAILPNRGKGRISNAPAELLRIARVSRY